MATIFLEQETSNSANVAWFLFWKVTCAGSLRIWRHLVTLAELATSSDKSSSCFSFEKMRNQTIRLLLTMNSLVLFLTNRSSRLLSLLSTQSAASSSDQSSPSSSALAEAVSLLYNSSTNTESSNGSRIPVHQFAGVGFATSREHFASPAAAAM